MKWTERKSHAKAHWSSTSPNIIQTPPFFFARIVSKANLFSHVILLVASSCLAILLTSSQSRVSNPLLIIVNIISPTTFLFTVDHPNRTDLNPAAIWFLTLNLSGTSSGTLMDLCIYGDQRDPLGSLFLLICLSVEKRLLYAKGEKIAICIRAQILLQLLSKDPSKGSPQYHQTSTWATSEIAEWWVSDDT